MGFHSRRPSLRHPVRAIVIAGVIVLTAANIWLDGVAAIVRVTPSLAMAMLICLALTVCTYWAPSGASAYLVLVYCIGAYAVQGMARYGVYMLLYAVAAIAYTSPERRTGLTLIMLYAYFAVDYLVAAGGVTTLYSALAHAMYVTLMAVLGGMLRLNEARTRRLHDALRAQHELERVRENQRIANRMHDAISQDLAIIALLAHRHDGGADADWTTVDERAHDALRDMRTLIRYLSDPHDAPAPNDGGFTPLHEWVRDNDAMLHQAGLQGHTDFDFADIRSRPDDGTIGLLRMVLQETYTNILKHAGRQSPYSITISITASTFVISYENALRPHGDEHPLPGGYGLTGIGDTVRELGGECAHHIEHGRWHGLIVIPIDAG